MQQEAAADTKGIPQLQEVVSFVLDEARRQGASQCEADANVSKGLSVTVRLGEVEMSFAYAQRFGIAPSTGYETLLHDAMNGEATLFQRSDMVEAGWRIVGPILDIWAALAPRDFPNYAAGSWGPVEAELLLARDDRAWRNPL